MRDIIDLVTESSIPDPRTNPRFRTWFGDSQAVDVAGHPLAMYHGSNAHAYVSGAIDIFDTLPASGRGAAFFTSSQQLAREYGERLYTVYLRLENPLHVYGNGKRWSELDGSTAIGGKVTDALRAHHRKEASELDDIFAQLSADGLDGFDGLDSAGPSPSKIRDDRHDLGGLRIGILPGLDSAVETDQIVRQARRMGYDGVIFHDIIDSPTGDQHLYAQAPASVFAVFHPAQIKAIGNAGQWSREDHDING